ncbi:TOG domain-containing protein [Aphelenchoides bicaudatus]|nr:TOG domain-containing protein [Aphelenchoides bicaudatus]
MVVKETDQIVDEQSSLDSLKQAAKSLEKALGGAPIEPDVLASVVKAIDNCKDIPENLIRGLAIVVASNSLNNVEHPSHRPFAILEALYKVNHAKTVEYFTAAVGKQLQSTSIRVSFDKRHQYIRTWLLKLIHKNTNKLSLELVSDALLLIAEISLHLPHKPLQVGLFGLHKQLDLPKLVDHLNSKVTSDPSNAWKVTCLSALLLRSLMSERKRRAEKSEQNGVAAADPNRVLLAKLWLKAFTNAYFSAKAYPGDDVFHFADGFNSFKLLSAKCPKLLYRPLANLFAIDVAFPAEIVNLIVELIPDTLSSTNDAYHEHAAQVVAKLLYFTDQAKRKKLLDAVFGKQSKVKSRNEYTSSIVNFIRKAYSGFGNQTSEHFQQFIADIFGYLEGELQAIKTDSVSANHSRLLAVLSQHINAKTDSATTKKYLDLAASIFKQPINSFPNCCTSAVEALAVCDVPLSSYPQTVIDSFKQHISMFGNAATSSDFVFFATLLLFKLSSNEQTKSKTDAYLLQALNLDFLTGLSLDAVSYGHDFVRQLFISLNGLDKTSFSKLQKNPAIFKFLLLSLEWPAKVKHHPSFKIEEHLLVLRPELLSWLLSNFTETLNLGDFGDLYTKQIDAINQHNMFDASQLLEHSHFIKKLPSILRQFVSSKQANKQELAELVFNAVVLANNNVRRNESLLKELETFLLKDEKCNKAIFEDFFEQAIIDRVYKLEPLNARQNVIGFLIALETENSRHRQYAWKKCLDLCEKVQIDKLNEVTDKNAEIFFTPEGTLCNSGIIDEYSDAALDRYNIKRENKAYKHKDQLAEIDLRKELAEKNKREGKLNTTPTRCCKKGTDKRIAPKELTDLLPIVVRSDPNGALQNYQIFHSFVVPVLKSELVGKLMLNCVRAYRDTFFSTESSDYLDGRVLSALLRSARSHLKQPDWHWEPMPEQFSKVMSSLQTLCMMNDLLGEQDAADALEALQNEENDEDSFNEGITLGKLAFVVPILERIYTDPKIDQRLRREATNFLKAAFALDFLTVQEREWLPIKRINELLLEVMCDANNVAYFDDVFELMKGILQKLNDENCASENVGKYVRHLITQLRNPNEVIREHVAQLLMFCKDIISNACIKSNDIPHLSIISIASKDVYRQTENKLHELTEELGIVLKPEMHNYVVDQLRYPYQFWQKATATTLCFLFQKQTIKDLDNLYNELLTILPAVTDKVGRVITPERDQWESRRGVANAFEFYIDSDLYDISLFESLLEFLVPDGVSDQHELVRNEMYKAASALISRSGAEKVDFVLPHLENLLNKLPDTAENDILRNGLVCLLGTLARYLEPNSPRLRTIFARLMDALSVPSRQVQESVANCLPPLALLIKDHAMDELKRLFRSLPQGKKFAERAGYAYGVAGLTKGLGLNTLKEISFMSTILDVHKRAFDPYIKRLLQPLIKAFGDQDDTVRLSSQSAGAQMMKSITPQAAKVFLPEILSGLDSEAWRAKCASADFLGSLSNCAAEQLSECLPKVVPGLANLMTDSHHKVKNSGVNALKQIATVITNPEVLAISSHLISALIEPAKETTRALTIIVNTQFIHIVDAPALALIMPILKRALNDRDPDGRKMASQVVTNLFAICGEKDIEPYMGVLIVNLKHSLLDPSPEVRSAAAQAIGSIVRHNTSGVFSSYTTDLIPWLKERMMSKSSMVDRLGAAQGMAEVVAAFESGTEAIMTQAIDFASSPNNDPAIRDGYIRLFTYLPTTMGERFINYIERVIPSILSALSDETEYLRNSSLQCGQILIKTYCSQAKRYLLPSLLEGVLNESWRIRHASITLIGDFLFNISGISSKMTSDTANEDDTFGLQAVDKTIVKYVGQKLRDRILISLYMARFDAGVQVRQAASHVWKLIVSNTPRTVKELLSELFELVVYCVSTSTDDRRYMATMCLEEVVRKMGERIMEALMPEVEKALDSEKTVDHRRGAIEALSVMITSTPSSEVFEQFNELIVRIFRASLCASDLRLRQASGETFAVYHNKVGIGALQEIVDPFFDDYKANESEEVLDGIVAILSVNRRGRVLTVPSLVNRILKFKSKAYVLSRLVDVISETIERNFIQIFTALFDDQPKPLTDEYFGQCATLLKAITSNYTIVGMYKFLALRAVEGDELAVKLMAEMIKQEDLVRDETISMLVENTMLLYTSEHLIAQTTGNKVMSSLISKCTQNEALEIPTNLLAFAIGCRDESKKVHGLNAPGGWKPFTDLLAICSRGGSMDQREVTVHAIADLLQMTESSASLRPVTPSVVAILLRLLADQCPTLLKLYSIQAISVLLEKARNFEEQRVPESIRAFAPQLTNFMRRILQESEDEAMTPDAASLVDLTETTLEQMQKLVPGRV